MMIDDMYDVLIEYNVATDDEIQLVTNINGWNTDALMDILYVRTGYRTFESYLESVGLD